MYDDTSDAEGPEAPQSPSPSERKKFDLSAMLKKNPKAVQIGAGVGVLLVLVVLLWYFMFSGSDKKRGRQAGPMPGPPAHQMAMDAGMDMDDDDPDEADGPAEPGDAAPADGLPAPPPKEVPEEPPLPDDVAEWEPEHFERARREGHENLLAAVGHLGRGAADREAAATVLVTLLQPPEPEETEEAAPGAAPGPVRQPVYDRTGRSTDTGRLAEAVVAALAVNATPTALAALEQVLAGELTPEGDEARVVEASLKSLAENPSAGGEDLLFRVLTASDRFREPSGTGVAVTPGRLGVGTAGQPLSAEWLRGQVLTLAPNTASAAFRAKLATFLAQPTTPLAWRAEMGKFLLDPNAANLGAQFIMYQNSRLEDDVRSQIEAHFAARSGQATLAVLGVPQEALATGPGAGRGVGGRGVGGVGGVGVGRGTAPAEPDDPELPFRLARQLWGERSTEAFAQRLSGVDRRTDRGHLLALCATMPVESVRSALLKNLRAQHANGPDAIEKAGIPGAMISDPGFLLVVKSLDRQEPQAATPTRPGVRGQPQPAPGRGADAAGQKWMKFSETLVRSWCGRLEAAALVQAEKARLAGKNPETLRRLEDLPIKLHDGADVRSAFHLVLPSGAPAEKLAGAQVGPMRVQYVRIEERTSMKRMLGFYRREARVRDGRPIDEGFWLDSYRPAGAAGLRCSLDVLIRVPGQKGGRDMDLDAEVPMIIEVLSVEAREP